MTRTSNVEEFIPHYEPVSLSPITAALADLNPRQTLLGLSIALPYTRRADGTVDTIEIGDGPGSEWTVYTGRDYHGTGLASVTAVAAQCPGHMVILVVRALYSHLSTVGPQGRKDTAEGDILYALGLTRDAAADVETAIKAAVGVPGSHWALVYDSGNGIRAKARRSPVDESKIEAVVWGCVVDDENRMIDPDDDHSWFPYGDGITQHDTPAGAARWILRNV
jgi:hypothetical protein